MRKKDRQGWGGGGRQDGEGWLEEWDREEKDGEEGRTGRAGRQGGIGTRTMEKKEGWGGRQNGGRMGKQDRQGWGRRNRENGGVGMKGGW